MTINQEHQFKVNLIESDIGASCNRKICANWWLNVNLDYNSLLSKGYSTLAVGTVDPRIKFALVNHTTTVVVAHETIQKHLMLQLAASMLSWTSYFTKDP